MKKNRRRCCFIHATMRKLILWKSRRGSLSLWRLRLNDPAREDRSRIALSREYSVSLLKQPTGMILMRVCNACFRRKPSTPFSPLYQITRRDLRISWGFKSTCDIFLINSFCINLTLKFNVEWPFFIQMKTSFSICFEIWYNDEDDLGVGNMGVAKERRNIGISRICGCNADGHSFIISVRVSLMIPRGNHREPSVL